MAEKLILAMIDSVGVPMVVRLLLANSGKARVQALIDAELDAVDVAVDALEDEVAPR